MLALRPLEPMALVDRRLYDVIDSLAPHATSLAVKRAYMEAHGKISLAAVWQALNRLEEAGWIDKQQQPGGSRRGGYPEALFFIARRPEH